MSGELFGRGGEIFSFLSIEQSVVSLGHSSPRSISSIKAYGENFVVFNGAVVLCQVFSQVFRKRGG